MATDDWKTPGFRQSVAAKMYILFCLANKVYQHFESIIITFTFLFFKFTLLYFSEDAIRLSGNPTTKTASEMETHFFQRATTRVSTEDQFLPPLIFYPDYFNSTGRLSKLPCKAVDSYQRIEYVEIFYSLLHHFSSLILSFDNI